jgi:hypothetical protein
MTKKEDILKQHHSLSSPIYSYDIADNDYYQGIMMVEQTLRKQQKKQKEKQE